MTTTYCTCSQCQGDINLGDIYTSIVNNRESAFEEKGRTSIQVHSSDIVEFICNRCVEDQDYAKASIDELGFDSRFCCLKDDRVSFHLETWNSIKKEFEEYKAKRYSLTSLASALVSKYGCDLVNVDVYTGCYILQPMRTRECKWDVREYYVQFNGNFA